MTDKEKIEEKDSVIGCFGAIAFILALVLIFTFGALLGDTEIVTKERIEPEHRLVTDGKVVDTLFIYKEGK